MVRSSRSRSALEPARASIVDVARLAGVSVATVSRALRGLPNVSDGTRERVLGAASDLEYIASPLAAALVTGRTRSVGVVASYTGRWFFAEALRGIEEGLRDSGYDLVLHVLPPGPRREQFFVGLPVRRRVDALAVVGLQLSPVELEALRQLRIPIVAVAEALPGVPTERIDNAAAAALAGRHLVELGHRMIAMIGADRSGQSARARGFAAGLGDLAPVAVLDGGFTPAGGAAAMTALLQRPQPPTAVFCESDEMAFGALQAIRQAGLRCPDDVSVVGFDDHELAAALDLTTVAQPVAEQGAAAARRLATALEAGPLAGDGVHEVRLVRRGSTGPFRG